MSKNQWKALALSLVAALTTLILVITATASVTLAQVTSVNQYTDVSPGEYYYESLRSLTERYGCIAGYGDGTYRANTAMTRGEFANILNSCLLQLERFVQSTGSDTASKEDVETLQRLTVSLKEEVESIRQSTGGSSSPNFNEPI